MQNPIPSEPEILETPKGNKVQTLHPAGKQGVKIDANKYAAMRTAILLVVPATAEGVLLKELGEAVRPHLAASGFDPKASVLWYLMAVKQDLEARGVVELVPRSSPQRLRLSER